MTRTLVLGQQGDVLGCVATRKAVPPGLSGLDPAVPKPLTHQPRQLGPTQPAQPRQKPPHKALLPLAKPSVVLRRQDTLDKAINLLASLDSEANPSTACQEPLHLGQGKPL